MQNVIFVSGADRKYYPILIEWVHSVRAFPEGRGVPIGIIDAGLTAEQVQSLKEMGCQIVKPDWPFAIPESKIRGREFLKSCICRPFLPNYFPGYETILWMDADTWVQNWQPVQMFIEAARQGAIALTAQVDRAYPRQVRIGWLGPIPFKMKGFYFSNAKKAFGFKTAKKLYPYHVLLAGMFALRTDAPHWKRWQELMQSATVKGNVFTAEQLSLGMMCYLEKYSMNILPAWTHWLCEFKPLWNEEKQKFVEPYMPYNELGVLHMAGFDDMRIDRSITTEFKTTSGGTVMKSWRYPYFDGEDVSQSLAA
jgi:hypothetical protein